MGLLSLARSEVAGNMFTSKGYPYLNIKEKILPKIFESFFVC